MPLCQRYLHSRRGHEDRSQTSSSRPATDKSVAPRARPGRSAAQPNPTQSLSPPLAPRPLRALRSGITSSELLASRTYNTRLNETRFGATMSWGARSVVSRRACAPASNRVSPCPGGPPLCRQGGPGDTGTKESDLRWLVRRRSVPRPVSRLREKRGEIGGVAA